MLSETKHLNTETRYFIAFGMTKEKALVMLSEAKHPNTETRCFIAFGMTNFFVLLSEAKHPNILPKDTSLHSV